MGVLIPGGSLVAPVGRSTQDTCRRAGGGQEYHRCWAACGKSELCSRALWLTLCSCYLTGETTVA